MSPSDKKADASRFEAKPDPIQKTPYLHSRPRRLSFPPDPLLGPVQRTQPSRRINAYLGVQRTTSIRNI